jgi:hypothetical protein
MWKRKAFFGTLLLLSLLVFSCEPLPAGSGGQSGGSQPGGGSSGSPAWNSDWDKPFGQPQYLNHATGHGTMDGPRDDDWYFLFPNAPTNGGLALPDGMGGTFGYSIDYSGGPYNTPSEVCAAVPSAAAEGTFSAWNSSASFNCKEVNAARNNRGNPAGNANDNNNPGNNGNDGNNNGNNGNNGGNNPGNGNNPPQANLSAWTSCSGFVELVPGEVSKACDVCVLDWNSNTSAPVTVAVTPPTGIIVFPGDTSDDPGNMFNAGVSDHQEYCFGELWRAEGIGPGQYNVPISVSQGGGGVITLSVLAQVPESGFPFGVCPTTRSLTITGRGWSNNDWISEQGYGADGKVDLFVNVTVTVDDPQAYITDFELQVTDSNGRPITEPVMAWSTTPSGVKPFLGAFSPQTNQWLNDPNRGWAIQAAMGGTTANWVYDWLQSNQFRLMVTAYFGNNASCTAGDTR